MLIKDGNKYAKVIDKMNMTVKWGNKADATPIKSSAYAQNIIRKHRKGKIVNE